MIRYLLLIQFTLCCQMLFSQNEAEIIFQEATAKLLMSNMEMEIDQQITDKKGRVKEKSFNVIWAKFDEEEMMKMTMLAPERAAGIIILLTKSPDEEGIIEIFTPANGKTRKMIATPKNMAMVGSDFSVSNYSDVKIEDLDIVLMDDKQIEDKDYSKLEIRKKGSKNDGKAELLVEKESLQIAEVHTYDRNGTKSTISGFSDYQPIKGTQNKWQPMSIVTEDLENNKKVEIHIKKVKILEKISKSDFAFDIKSE